MFNYVNAVYVKIFTMRFPAARSFCRRTIYDMEEPVYEHSDS